MNLHFDHGGFILGPRMFKHIQTNKCYIPYQQKSYDHINKCRKMALEKLKLFHDKTFFFKNHL